MANDMTPAAVERSLDLAAFLEGQTRAWGVFEDRFGRVKRRFTVDIDGRWVEGELKVVEDFLYDDGEQEQRVWWISRGAEGRFTARSDDCIGVAEGRSSGDTSSMGYRYRLRMKSRSLDVAFHDTFYRMDATHVFNRAVVSKWGIELGVATIFFGKVASRLAVAA